MSETPERTAGGLAVGVDGRLLQAALSRQLVVAEHGAGGLLGLAGEAAGKAAGGALGGVWIAHGLMLLVRGCNRFLPRAGRCRTPA